MRNRNYILAFVLCLFIVGQAKSQFNIGIVTGGDLYQRYVNPDDGSGQDRSAGSAILNSNLGLKLWLGGSTFSVSAETYANLGFLGLNIEEYKGLGTFSLTGLAKLNFKGMSAFNIENKVGYYIGGGYQLNKTEFYGLSSAAKEAGAVRDYFPTYVIEIGAGNGSRNKVMEFYVRYGFGVDVVSSALHVGVNTTYSIPFFKKPSFNQAPKAKGEEEPIKM